jgi:hypothetical protein
MDGLNGRGTSSLHAPDATRGDLDEDVQLNVQTTSALLQDVSENSRSLFGDAPQLRQQQHLFDDGSGIELDSPSDIVNEQGIHTYYASRLDQHTCIMHFDAFAIYSDPRNDAPTS